MPTGRCMRVVHKVKGYTPADCHVTALWHFTEENGDRIRLLFEINTIDYPMPF